MFCKLVKLKMNDYLERRLPVMDRQLVDSHLASCEHCRQLAETMRLVVTTLRGLPQQSLGDQFESRLMGKLPKSVSVWQSVSDFWSQWIMSPGHRFAMAGVGIAVAAVMLFSPQWVRRESPQQPGADPGHSSFVMQCIEQHVAFTSDQTMPETLSLDRVDESSQPENF